MVSRPSRVDRTIVTSRDGLTHEITLLDSEPGSHATDHSLGEYPVILLLVTSRTQTLSQATPRLINPSQRGYLATDFGALGVFRADSRQYNVDDDYFTVDFGFYLRWNLLLPNHEALDLLRQVSTVRIVFQIKDDYLDFDAKPTLNKLAYHLAHVPFPRPWSLHGKPRTLVVAFLMPASVKQKSPAEQDQLARFLSVWIEREMHAFAIEKPALNMGNFPDRIVFEWIVV
jgi:hypothetical protein